MKKTLFTLFAAALVLSAGVSCNKTDAPATKERTPVTITATIGSGEDTKISYTEDGNVLKTAWETSETISVITTSDAGYIVTIDNFTYSGPGGKTVDFTGTLSEGAAKHVRVVYPALEQYTNSSSETRYGTPRTEYSTNDVERLIRNISIGGNWLDSFNPNIFVQKENGSTAHLKDAIIYFGSGVISEGAMSVEVSPMSSVIKATFTNLPDEAKTKACDIIQISAYDSEDDSYSFQSDGFNLIGNSHSYGGYIYTSSVYLGSFSPRNYLPISGADALVVYLPIIPGDGGRVFGPSGASRLHYSYSSGYSSSLFSKEGDITLTKDLTLEPGKMYRLTVDMSK